MDRPQLRSQSVLDFVKWFEAGTLLLSPKFQRRRVWPPKARSFLVDTILKGMPIPKIYMRQQLELKSRKVFHEVVDGQQRIATAIEFSSDKFSLSKSHGKYAGKLFSELPTDVQESFLGYEFSVDLLVGASDADVLDIFARINSYSVPLNAQEKRNANFFGAFKQCVYSLGWEHLEFWKKHGVLSDQGIARMKEAELTSELIVAMLDGMQDKKKSLDGFYKKWDETFPASLHASTQFRAVIDTIEETLGDILKSTNFKRPALFYSLFVAFYALRFGDRASAGKKVFAKTNISNLRNAIVELSEAIDQDPPAAGYAKFVSASQRQTDNLNPRKIRYSAILHALEK